MNTPIEVEVRHGDQQVAFAAFVDEHLLPYASHWDRAQRLPDEVINDLAQRRWLVPTLPEQAGGCAMDAPIYGRYSEQLGRGCSSVRNLVAVQGMVAHAVQRWGTPAQVERWVPSIAAGRSVGAFALTEPGSGSDARAATTTATRVGAGVRLDGVKRWISFAQRAGTFLVFAQLDGELAAVLVERDNPGLAVEPIDELLGLRASELGEVRLDGCVVSSEDVLMTGRLAFDLVATMSLDYGRFSTACGSVGLAQGCLDATLDRIRSRTQFGAPLARHQLVQRHVTEMVTSIEAARLLCRQAGVLRQAQDPDAVRQTLIAKYYSSRTAVRTARDAVQLHGASGISADFPVQRHLRDATVQEIIEGTSEIQQLQIAELTMARSGRQGGRV